MLRKKPKDAAYITSPVGPEQFIEEIAEPRLEYVDLGVGNRHRVPPIVRDNLRFNVVRGRAPDARPGLRRDVKIVGQNAAFAATTAR